jgi:hypothetical protein
MLGCSPPDHLEVPTPRGFTVDDGTWRCDIARLEHFLAAVGGVEGSLDCGGTARSRVVASRDSSHEGRRPANGTSHSQRRTPTSSRAEIEAPRCSSGPVRPIANGGRLAFPGSLQV